MRRARSRADKQSAGSTRRPAQAIPPPIVRKSFAPHPADLTSFVGRHEDVASLSEQFDRGARLVTVFGPAGIGKTRLSRRVLGQTGAEVAGYFCDLQAAASGPDLCVALATSLGVSAPETENLADDLGRALEARGRCLVVFDNFEQLVETSRETLEGWLMQAPDACFLVTSRRLLRLRCEVAYELSPLSVETPDQESRSEAAQLFLERARSIEPSLAVNDDARRDVDALVQQLEGLPLAIELAAANIRRAGPAELLQDLKASRFALRDDPQRSERHRSLRIAMEQSWRLLTPVERTALGQLSVFRGGFDREAVERVLDAPEDSHRADVVARLREASWLRVTSTDPIRWNLYEAIREFAAGKLNDSGRTNEVRERLASYFLERGKGLIEGVILGAARSDLAHEVENLQATLRWYVESDQPEPAARSALILHELFRQRIPVAAEESVDLVIGQAPQASAWRLYLARAECRRRTGRYSEAEEDLGRAKSTCGLSDAPQIEIDLERGLLALERGSSSDALGVLEGASQRIENADVSTLLAGRILSALALTKAEMFRDRSCFELWDQAVHKFEEAGATDAAARARAFSYGYRVSLADNDLDPEALEQLRASSSSSNPDLECAAQLIPGCIERRQDNLDASKTLAERGLRLARRVGDRYWEANACFHLGLIHEQRADPEAALEMYRQGIATSNKTRSVRLRAWSQLGHAGVLSMLGSHDQAREQLKQLEMDRATDDPMILALHCLQSCRVEMARAHRDVATGQPDRAGERCRRARDLLALSKTEQTATLRPTTTAGWIQRDHSGRVWLQRLERELSDVAGTLPVLRVWRDGRAFSVASAPVVQVPDAPILRRVLTTLARERQEQPGSTLSTDELFERGWPKSNIAAVVSRQTSVERRRPTTSTGP